MKFLFEFMPFILLNLKHKGGLVGPGIPGGFRFFLGGGIGYMRGGALLKIIVYI